MRIRFDATAVTPFLTLDNNVPSWDHDLKPCRAAVDGQRVKGQPDLGSHASKQRAPSAQLDFRLGNRNGPPVKRAALTIHAVMAA